MLTQTELAQAELAPSPLRHPVADQGPVPNPLPHLLSGHDLTSKEAERLVERVARGAAPVELAGFVAGLKAATVLDFAATAI